METFDLVVIGAGSGNVIASAGADRDLSVALVEEGPMGGTCLNRGCIPSKMLIHRANVVETIRNADSFGIDAEITDVAFEDVVRSVNESVAADAAQIERGIEESENHTLYRSEGRFVDEKTLAVGDETIRGDRVVVAVGARPAVPSIEGINDVDYLTSTEALKLTERPDRLVVVGGGYIAAELAHFFGTLGTEVTIIGRNDVLLPNEDRAIAHTYTMVAEEKYDVHTGYEATAASQDGDEITVEATVADDGNGGDAGGDIELTGDELLVAVGLQPNTDRLAVEEAGIETDERGYVVVDEFLRTTASDVWAFGDVLGRYQYKHAANMEAEYLTWNLFEDHLHPVDYTAMPHAVFSSPQIAGVGATEAELREADAEYATRTYAYADTAMGDLLGEDDGFVKVLADPEDRRILGCHVVGHEASTIVHEVVIAMDGGGTVGDVAGAVHVHPALNEVVHRAFDGAFHRHDGGNHGPGDGDTDHEPVLRGRPTPPGDRSE